jgi:ribosomal protein S18 acetylase RimI-like enzyme
MNDTMNTTAAIAAPLTTRVATMDDIDAIAILFDAYRQFYQQAPDLALAQRFIGERLRNDESVIILAADESQGLVGFCQLYPSFCSVEAKPIYTLYDLFVTPLARRLGAGRVLLLAAENLATDQGKARLDLTTAKTNLAAQAAYESLAWIRDEVFYAYSKPLGQTPP